jgi:hypothetical protein
MATTEKPRTDRREQQNLALNKVFGWRGPSPLRRLDTRNADRFAHD